MDCSAKVQLKTDCDSNTSLLQIKQKIERSRKIKKDVTGHGMVAYLCQYPDGSIVLENKYYPTELSNRKASHAGESKKK